MKEKDNEAIENIISNEGQASEIQEESKEFNPDSVFRDILRFASSKKASDIHLSGGRRPYIRANGLVEPVNKIRILSNREVVSMISPYMNEYHKKEFRERKQTDFGLQIKQSGSRYRTNVYKTMSGVSIALREIGSRIPTMEELGLPKIVEKMANLSKGLILVTGPTGSGKSTTLSSIINYINSRYRKHIITIEDPIEFIYSDQGSIINQRELGRDVVSFADALRGALREDPDVILVGEMRDRETIQLALTAAETGHLVLGTLHTSSAVKTLDRIIDTFPGSEKDYVKSMLSTSLEAVIAQRLLPKLGGRERIAVFEILLANDPVRNMIRQGQNPQIKSAMQIYSKEGMVTLSDSVKKLLKDGKISKESADHILNRLE